MKVAQECLAQAVQEDVLLVGTHHLELWRPVASYAVDGYFGTWLNGQRRLRWYGVQTVSHRPPWAAQEAHYSLPRFGQLDLGVAL